MKQVKFYEKLEELRITRGASPIQKILKIFGFLGIFALWFGIDYNTWRLTH